MTKIKINCTSNPHNMIIILHIDNVCKFKLNLLRSICFLFYASNLCMSAYAQVYFKQSCECIVNQYSISPRSIAGVPFDSVRRFQASLLLKPPSLCLSAVLDSLAVWIQNQKKKNIY